MTKEEALKFSVKALLPLIKRAAPYGEDDWLDGKEAVEKCNSALAQPAQEPVAWGYRNRDGAIYDCISPEAHADVEGDYTVPLYTTPQQRPWVGLTDKDLKPLSDKWRIVYGGWVEDFAKEIEAALRSKNHGSR
jgi:hypothetical protein